VAVVLVNSAPAHKHSGGGPPVPPKDKGVQSLPPPPRNTVGQAAAPNEQPGNSKLKNPIDIVAPKRNQ